MKNGGLVFGPSNFGYQFYYDLTVNVPGTGINTSRNHLNASVAGPNPSPSIPDPMHRSYELAALLDNDRFTFLESPHVTQIDDRRSSPPVMHEQIYTLNIPFDYNKGY